MVILFPFDLYFFSVLGRAVRSQRRRARPIRFMARRVEIVDRRFAQFWNKSRIWARSALLGGVWLPAELALDSA